MEVRAQEMRVVSSYGPNITLKGVQRRSLKYWAKGKIFSVFYLHFYVVQDLATRGSGEPRSDFLAEYF